MSLINKILSGFLGNKSERDIKEIMPIVDKIREIYPSITKLSHDELRAHSAALRTKVRSSVADLEAEIVRLREEVERTDDFDAKENLYERIDRIEKEIDARLAAVMDEVLPEAFAIMKDTARRFVENDVVEVTANDFDREMAAKYDHVEIKGDKALWHSSWMAGGNRIRWDMVHYDVQLIGGVVLHQGKIAEMATGEGKTLVATLPVFLNALSGRGVHIVTVNDYLSRRDSEWMGPLYQFHGLSVDCIDKHQPNSEARRKAYQADITFGTNNEFGFDYLRDNMALSPEDLVQREHVYAIVDEVDSVLIDDARTPLIISGPVPKGDDQLFEELKPRVENLVNAQRKLVNQVLADARKYLAEGNLEKAGFNLLQAYKGLPKHNALIKLLSEQGNKALLLKTENFYMQENSKNMHLVTDDLYFIIDEKNNSVELTDKGIDLITAASEDPHFFHPARHRF